MKRKKAYVGLRYQVYIWVLHTKLYWEGEPKFKSL